jgi:hypothetical protein
MIIKFDYEKQKLIDFDALTCVLTYNKYKMLEKKH